MRRLRKFASLPGVERRLILEEVLLLWAVRFSLWVLPFRIVNGYVATHARARRRSRAAVPLDRLAWILGAAGTLLPGKRTCLVRALAGRLLVAGEGYTPTLRLGVARDADGRLDAHAWLECDGRVLVGGGGLDRYTPFPTHSHSGPGTNAP